MTPGRRLLLSAGVVLLALAVLYASMIRVHWQTPAPTAAPARQMAAAVLQSPDRAAAAPHAVPDHGQLAVPVAGVARSAIHDNWGDPRGNGQREHHGTDIMAPENTPVIAAAAGTVEKLFFSQGGGGITAYVRSPDRLWSYYYAHLSGYAPGLAEGQQVKPGDPIGFVGDTGNAGEGNFHLHFGMSRMRPDERWWQGEAINPYPLLAGNGGGG